VNEELQAEVARRFGTLALAEIVYTDIEVEGTLHGPNLAATEASARR
jgi:phosphoribosylformimino-5-aminoimidazole carboxamide ribonucleotide (ProFAR) isomerase